MADLYKVQVEGSAIGGKLIPVIPRHNEKRVLQARVIRLESSFILKSEMKSDMKARERCGVKRRSFYDGNLKNHICMLMQMVGKKKRC